MVLVWLYLGVFNLACPILYSCKSNGVLFIIIHAHVCALQTLRKFKLLPCEPRASLFGTP